MWHYLVSLLSGGNLNGTADDEYKWLKGLKERYEELITTFVTSQKTDFENGAKKEDNSMLNPAGWGAVQGSNL